MTNTPTSGTDPVHPVSIHENEANHNMPLMAERVFSQSLAAVTRLRKRQADYLASLPTTAEDCGKAALGLLHPEGETYPEGFEEALYLSFALEPMIHRLDTDEPCIERDALLFIAGRVRWGLERSAVKLDLISDLLCNPNQIEREAARRKLT